MGGRVRSAVAPPPLGVVSNMLLVRDEQVGAATWLESPTGCRGGLAPCQQGSACAIAC